MLILNYFASIRESTGRSRDEMSLPDSVTSVSELIDYLVANSGKEFAMLADESRVLVAVNQTVVSKSHPLSGNEEVAFFPPMTGG